MNCNFAVKVSMMIDGELSAEGNREIKAHIAGCAECRSIKKDFLFLSDQIRGLNDGETAQMPEVPYFYSEKRSSVWKRKFLIPVFVFGFAVLIFAGLGVRFLVMQSGKNEQAANPNLPSTPKSSTPDKSSLEIFDKGGRAEIYIVHRQAK